MLFIRHGFNVRHFISAYREEIDKSLNFYFLIFSNCDYSLTFRSIEISI